MSFFFCNYYVVNLRLSFYERFYPCTILRNRCIIRHKRFLPQGTHGVRNLSQIILCVGPFRKNIQEGKINCDQHKKESLHFKTR